MFQFLLPDPGEGLQEADVTQWLVAEGDEVRVNDALVEIETAKSLVELPSPVSGTIHKILVEAGQTVDVGTPIIEIDDGSSDPAIQDGSPSQNTAEPTTPADLEPTHSSAADIIDDLQDETPKFLVGSGPAAEPTMRTRLAKIMPTGKVLAKPLVRRLARDLGIDLANLRPTGPHGSVSREDVEAAAGAQSQPLASSTRTVFAPILDGRREPIKGVRKATAANLADSVSRHITVTEYNTIDISATVELVEALKTRREFKDRKVSPLLIYAKAVTIALQHHPIMNASWDEANQEIVYHDDVNLGIAAATPRGLLVPVIRQTNKMTLVELADELNRIVKVARDGKLTPHDYSDGTFTITNVGVFGIDTGTPVINGSEAAILAMGAHKRRPWVVGQGDDERIEARWVTTLALSFDHQQIDGEQGSKFLADLCLILENPQMAMLF